MRVSLPDLTDAFLRFDCGHQASTSIAAQSSQPLRPMQPRAPPPTPGHLEQCAAVRKSQFGPWNVPCCHCQAEAITAMAAFHAVHATSTAQREHLFFYISLGQR